MAEVYDGVRSGHRTALLIVSAAVLAGALGLAWLQVQGSRVLGPERRIPGTPLYVCPPRGWQPDPQDPSAFVLPVRVTVYGQQYAKIERKIQFTYQRLPSFRPPAEIVASLAAASSDIEPARIGTYPAVQVRQIERRRWRRQIIVAEMVLRVAVLPGGELIAVRYLPMTDLTPADLKLLDRVCNTVRLVEPRLTVAAEQAQQHAGVAFTPGADWQFALPELPEVPGLYVSGTAGGHPAWTFGLFRTWLAEGRTARELLADLAAWLWLLSGDQAAPAIQQREDGALIAALRHPDPAHNPQPVAAAWVVSQSPSQVVLMLVYTNEQYLQQADAAAEQLARGIRIEPLSAIPDLSAAAKAGAALAELLTRKGPAAWWGRRPTRLRYEATGSTTDERIVVQVEREALARDPGRGYQGSEVHSYLRQRYDEPTHWSIDATGQCYTYRSTRYAREGVRISVEERRATATGQVSRVIRFNDLERGRYTFEPGPLFICPPMESLAEGWVASRGQEPHLIAVSTLLGAGTHTRLLRPLAPEEDHPRLLLQLDYWPLGAILAFDEGELLYQVEPAARYQLIRDDRAP